MPFHNQPSWMTDKVDSGHPTLLAEIVRAKQDMLKRKLAPQNYQPYPHKRISALTPLQESSFKIAERQNSPFHPIHGLHQQAHGHINRSAHHNVHASMAPYLAAGTQHPTENMHKYQGPTQDMMDAASFFTQREMEKAIRANSKHYSALGHRNSTAKDKRLNEIYGEGSRHLMHAVADIKDRAYSRGLESELAHAGHQLNAGQMAGSGANTANTMDLERARAAQQAAQGLQTSEALRMASLSEAGSKQQAQNQLEMNTHYGQWKDQQTQQERAISEASEMYGPVQILPHSYEDTAVAQAPTQSLPSVMGQMGAAAAFNMMRPNQNASYAHRSGGRINLARGGSPHVDPQTLQNMMQMVNPHLMHEYQQMGGMNNQPPMQQFDPSPYALPPMTHHHAHHPAPPPMAMMDNTPPPPPIDQSNPLKRGASDAMDTINDMHIKKMQDYANRLEQPSENGMNSYFSHLFSNMAANPSADLATRLGQATPHAQAAYEHANAVNQQRQDTSAKLHMEIQKTIALQKYREMKANESHRHNEAMENKPVYRTDPVSGGTFQIINGMASSVPGTPPPLTSATKLALEAEKLAQEHRLKSDYASLENADKGASIASHAVPIINQLMELAPGIGNTGQFTGELPNAVGALLADPDKRQLADKLSSDLVKANVKAIGGSNPSNQELKFAQKITPSLSDNPNTFMMSLRGHYVAHQKTMAYAPFKHDMYEKYHIPMYEIDKAWNQWDAKNRLLSPDLKTFHIPKKTPLDYFPKEFRERVPADYDFNSVLMGKSGPSESQSIDSSGSSQESYTEALKAHIRRLQGEQSKNPTERILSQSHGLDIYDT